MDLLRYAVSVEDESEGLEAFESSLPTETTIVDVCANLISIDMAAQVVRFVHFSVQEFVTSHQFCFGTFDLGPESAHREIARMFIILLKFVYSQKLGDSLFRYFEILQECYYHLIHANLGALSVDDGIVTLVASFFDRSPPVLITSTCDRPTFLSFSPPTLELIFNLPSEYQLYQVKPVYHKTFSYESLMDIYRLKLPSQVFRSNPVVIFDDRFAMHYTTVVLDSISVAQRLYDHGYPIDCWYNAAADHLNFECARSDNYCYPWSQMADIYRLPPLYSVQSKKMAMFLLDNGAKTDPIACFSWADDVQYDDPFACFSWADDAQLSDPLAWFAGAGNTQLTELISNRIVYQHAQRHSTALQPAVHNCRVECIQLLLDKGADVNAEGGKYGTALQAAAGAYFNNIECIQLLLNKGANVNAEGGKYGTALQAAASKYFNNTECIQLLLNKGADVNAEGGKYGTALQAAAYAGRDEIIQLLLDNGADINAEGGKYSTALQAAARVGQLECMQLLLDKGIDVNAKGGKFGTALQAAARGSQVECMKLLLDKGADVNAEGGIFGAALQAAVYSNNLMFTETGGECLQLLLDQGADVNKKGGKFGTALQVAVAHWPRIECIQLLLDKGADVNTEGGDYGTALQAAAYNGRVEIIQLLLDKGADVNAEGGKYSTALQAAAYKGVVKIMQLLLDKGADVNAEGGEYGTALQAAARGGRVECLQLLLDNGIDVNFEGGKYGTTLQAAACGGQIGCIQLLLNNGADVNAEGGEFGAALQAAAYSDDGRSIEYIEHNGADVNAAVYSDDGRSIQCIELLLDNGADINAKSGIYGTALQAAASNSRMRSIRLLLDNGTDINTEGGKYGTALHAASYACRLEVVKELLSRGANVNAQGGKYGTALQATLAPAPAGDERLTLQKHQYVTFDVLELLLDHGADITAYVEDSEFGDALTAAKQVWKSDKEALNRFMKLWESGKRKGG